MAPRLFLCLLLVALSSETVAATATATATAADLPPRVLILMSYHRGQPWEDGIAAGLLEALGGRAEPVFIHFDHKRFPQADTSGVRLAAAIDAVARASPRLVIAVDDHAWSELLAHRTQLAPGLPLVFCGLNHWDPASRPPDATGVVESFDPAGTLALAFAAHPRARRLVLLNDATDTGAGNRRTFEAVMPAAAQGREVSHIGLGTWAETEAALAGLDPLRDVVLMLTWNLDASGATQGHEDSVRRARRVCRAPIYGVWDFQFGFGIVGGSLFDSRVHGREAGELALRILDGTPASNLAVRDQPRTRLVVDASELARFAVTPAALPAGVEVVGAEPSFWREFGAVVALILAVIVAQGATIAGLVIVLRRQRRAEAARREAEARLRQGSRMDAVGQLAAGVAHDFNNVLTAILGHADLLGLRLEADSPLRSHVDTIAGAAQRAAGTVRNLLSFARGRSSQSHSCDVNRLVLDVVALLQHALDRRVQIDCRPGADAGTARIGADELQQVLINLALNARDAMPDGGRLEITSERVELASDAGRLGVTPGAYVLVTVRDSGQGIAPEHLERIFDPFFTTKPLGKGTGLGLAVVHGAVHAAQGAMRVESQVGQGTAFRLWLPATSGTSSTSIPVSGSIAGLTVLLVDDEAVVLEVVGALMRACGATVHEFTEPAAASAWFAGHADEVSLALLDGNMPGLTGWQLAVRLREARPDLRVVALTGAATAEALAAWRAAGVGRVLQKPVNRAQLQAVLTEAREASGPRPTV